ncbi:replication initiation protein [Empedobacter falsenii]|uniref:replication initiation protein n=1 Tax=Empedobacter falsenii TaxID=343874 RepID=UPI00068D7A4E|nr:replication initiation protein [Empedobacter falsenii]
MIIKEKELIQSYILTTAKYDYKVFEKRIFYRIIEQFQYLIEGKELNKKYSLIRNNDDSYKIKIPYNSLLKSTDDKNHKQFKNALKSLESKSFEYEDDDLWELVRLIEKPKAYKRNEYVEFDINPRVVEVLINFAKGFRKLRLDIALSFETTYAMRFYELISEQKKPINYSIENLKKMFLIENKYNDTNNFIKRVVDSAKKELDEKSPYTFYYDKIKTGKKITSLRFIPIYQPQFDSEIIQKKNLNKLLSNRWFIPKNIEDYLKYNFEFTEKELSNNLNLFEVLYNNLSEEILLDFLTELREPSTYADNRKGFIIGALKKRAEQLLEDKTSKARTTYGQPADK